MVKRDLKGVIVVLRGMKDQSGSLPDLVLALDCVAHALESCVSELAALQVEVRDQAELLTDHQVFIEEVGKRVAGLETQGGLASALEGDDRDFEEGGG